MGHAGGKDGLGSQSRGTCKERMTVRTEDKKRGLREKGTGFQGNGPSFGNFEGGEKGNGWRRGRVEDPRVTQSLATR